MEQKNTLNLKTLSRMSGFVTFTQVKCVGRLLWRMLVTIVSIRRRAIKTLFRDEPWTVIWLSVFARGTLTTVFVSLWMRCKVAPLLPMIGPKQELKELVKNSVIEMIPHQNAIRKCAPLTSAHGIRSHICRDSVRLFHNRVHRRTHHRLIDTNLQVGTELYAWEFLFWDCKASANRTFFNVFVCCLLLLWSINVSSTTDRVHTIALAINPR